MPPPAPAQTSLSALIEDLARRHGDAPAIVSEAGTIGFAGFAERVRRTAAGLAGLGLAAGDRIALWLPTSVDYLALCFAAWRLGAIVVAVNTRYRASELSHLLGGTRPRLLALAPGFAGIDVGEILAGVDPDRLASIEALLGAGDNWQPPEALRHAAMVPICALAEHPAGAEPVAAATAPAAIFTTSGTTRAPKFVLHRQAGIARHAIEAARAMGFDAPDAVTLQTLPLCAVFGFSQALAALAGGRKQVSMAMFEPAAAAALIRRHRVTHGMATDEMWARMLAARPEPRPFRSVRLGGFAAFNPALGGFFAEAERRGLPLIGLYGMSEVLALFAARRREDPDDRRLAAGGLPVSAAARVRARDAESGAVLPHGETGLLEMRGPSVMAGYYDDPAATAAAFTEDGYLRTGDLGWSEPEGGFAYLARAGDVLRLGGFLVAPAEIEAHLERHPDLAGVQVVGAAAAGRPCAVAFVRMRDGARFDEAALKRHCGAALARYKVPERIVALAEFPVTLSGNGTKIQRQKLREMAEALFA